MKRAETVNIGRYVIPGEKGSLQEGERYLNFLWYTNETAGTIDEIMTDNDGHHHHFIVPAGKVRLELWKKVLDRAYLLSKQHRKVMNKIQAPFIQSITAPRAAFAGGKILLLGDSVSLYRPHTASSTNQVAFNCLMLEKLILNKVDIEEWNGQLVEFANIHWARSV